MTRISEQMYFFMDQIFMIDIIKLFYILFKIWCYILYTIKPIYHIEFTLAYYL